MTVAVEHEPCWVTSEMAAVHLQWQGVFVSPATIRKWAERGHIRVGGSHRFRYDLWSVQEWVDRRKQGPT